MGETSFWRDQLAFWRKQMTPRKLLFYFLFHGLHVGIFILGWYGMALLPSACPWLTFCRYLQESDPNLAALNSLHFSVWFSRGAGLVLTVDTTLILLPMCRNLMTWLRPKVRWLPLDETQWFHRQVAYTMLFWVIVHVSSHYVKYGCYSNARE